MKNDSEWMLSVLADLLEFCEDNELVASQKAIEAALQASRLEIEELRQTTPEPDAADNTNSKPGHSN